MQNKRGSPGRPADSILTVLLGTAVGPRFSHSRAQGGARLCPASTSVTAARPWAPLSQQPRKVPEDVLRKMAAKLEPPSLDEGFDKIEIR